MTSHSTRSQSFNTLGTAGLRGNKSATQTPMMIFATLRLAVSKNGHAR